MSIGTWVPKYVECLYKLPEGLKAPSKLWFTFTADDGYSASYGAIVEGDYVGGIMRSLHRDDEPLSDCVNDAAGRLIGIEASDGMVRIMGENFMPSIAMNGMQQPLMRLMGDVLLVPYDGHQIGWTQLARHIGAEAGKEITLAVRNTVKAMLPMLKMHYTKDELDEVEAMAADAGHDLIDEIMTRFHLEIEWNQPRPSSVLCGGQLPWMLDIGIVGWFGEQEFKMDSEFCEGFLAEHPVHLPFHGDLAEVFWKHIPSIIDVVRDDIIGGFRHLSPRCDYFLKLIKAAALIKANALNATTAWNALPSTGIPADRDAHKRNDVAVTNTEKNRKKRERKKRSAADKREAGSSSSPPSPPPPRPARSRPQRAPSPPPARKRWQWAIRRVILENKESARRTAANKAKSEARRRMRAAINEEKARKAKEWEPSALPGIAPAVGKWAEEDPGESVRARARGKKAEALEERKEAIRKQREVYLEKMVKEAAEQAERDRLRAVGFAMMRDEKVTRVHLG
jgi:hypothetical protein